MDVLLFTTRLAIIACRHMVPSYYSGIPMKIPEIAKVYGFKGKSINPAFSALTKAGILNSRVGGRYADRGFTYAKDPKKITLYDIISTIEGDKMAPCCSGVLNCQPIKCAECSILEEFKQVIRHRMMILSKTTIYEHYEMLK